MFCSHFGAAVTKIINNTKNIPRKKFLEIQSLFFQPECPEKGRFLPKLDRSCRRVARNSQWGGAVWGVWGRNPQPPEANGGVGAKPPAAGGWGFGGKAPSRRRHGGLGAEPQALENFACFCKNNFILGLF